MRNQRLVWMATILLGASLFPGVVSRSEPKAPSKLVEKAEKAAPAPRLPPYFAQIGLSTDQRAKVLKVRQDYAPRIERLEQELAELASQRDAEVEALLTTDQKSKLESLRKTSRPKSPPRRRSRAPRRTPEKPARSPLSVCRKRASDGSTRSRTRDSFPVAATSFRFGSLPEQNSSTMRA